MSLINDALRRAREAQQHAPAPAGSDLQLRPVESDSGSSRKFRGWVPAVLLVLAVGGLSLVWAVSRGHNPAQPQTVAARSPAPEQAPNSAAVTPPAAESSPGGAPAKPAVTPADSDSVTASPPTNPLPVVAVPVAPPKPLPPRLQGIFLNPRRPCAMIDGKTVFVGDRLGPLTITAIARDTVILAGAGVTNVLSLAQ